MQGAGTREPAKSLSNEEIDRLIGRATELKVGGSYWAAQPELPDQPYVLLCVRNSAAREEAMASSVGPFLAWTDAADPWHLVSGASQVMADADDEVALVAAMSGTPVRCLGNGRFAALDGAGRSALRELFRSIACEAFADPYSGEAMDARSAIDLCACWRKLIDSNRRIDAALGFAFWKRPTVTPLLWSGSGEVPFVSKLPSSANAERLLVWKSRTPTPLLDRLEQSRAQLVEVEDGFIRSVGLGADCVPPLSIVVDELGIYFDPQRPSRLERFIAEGPFTEELLERARRLRALIVQRGISKYGVGQNSVSRGPGEKRRVLVPGQVEDDRSILCGGGSVQTNEQLLRRVREREPDAEILYKPHPDVEAGHRRGAIADSVAAELVDVLVRGEAISSLIDSVDAVHVNTSLVGFEALLRGKPVTTHGVPFYAGWGLTTDLGEVPDRRKAKCTLDQLVAATLLLYPRYVDPVTGLPCPPEILIQRLSEQARSGSGGVVVSLRRLQGRLKRLFSAVLRLR